jgi:hypothetical protein
VLKSPANATAKELDETSWRSLHLSRERSLRKSRVARRQGIWKQVERGTREEPKSDEALGGTSRKGSSTSDFASLPRKSYTVAQMRRVTIPRDLGREAASSITI